MSPFNACLCLLCVSLASVGQVLLRLVAEKASRAAHLADAVFAGSTLLAVSVYGGAMVMWLFVLSRVPLTIAFPFFGLCFLLVPLFAHWIVGDPVSLSTWLGGGIILVGISVGTIVR
jgi:undecaprenyl phosphate-alpha-L-ara4N flippase subunit ArnE